MDIGDLRIFASVARLGGMSRAAAALNTVQSNVTARIKLLEDELQTPLFLRHSRGVTLTPAGERLLPYADRAQHLLAEALQAVADDGTPKGPLVIGSLETTAALRLSPILTEYARAYPAVDVVLRTGTTHELIEAVLQRRAEGAFVCGPVEHPELLRTTVFREEMVLLSAPDVRSLDDVFATRELKIVVLRAGCSYRQRLEQILTRRGVVGLRVLELGTLEAIFGCVAAGLGITLLPRALIGPVWRGDRIRLHGLPATEARVETVFVRRRDASASSALAAFLALARQSSAQAAE